MDLQEHVIISEERTSTLHYENGKYNPLKIFAGISVFVTKYLIEHFFCIWISMHLTCGGFIIIKFVHH